MTVAQQAAGAAESWAWLTGDAVKAQRGATSGFGALYGKAQSAAQTTDWNRIAELGASALPFIFPMFGLAGQAAQQGAPTPVLVQAAPAPGPPPWFWPTALGLGAAAVVVYATGRKRR